MDEQQQKCLECQECCEYVEIPVTMLSMEVIEYFMFRGNQCYIDSKNGVFCLRVLNPCIHLSDNGCAIYNQRPEACRTYMCETRDKTVRDIKENQCSQSMTQIMKSLKQYKSKQGKQE